MSYNNFLTLLRFKRRAGEVVNVNLDPIDNICPRPFSERIHYWAFVLGLWAFVMLIVITFTL